MKAYRTTKQEQTILSVVKLHHNHPTADMIYLEVRQLDERISRGTVYRNLDKLCEVGELLRVKVPGAADRFDLRPDYHYHMFCTACGQVLDANMEYQETLDKLLSEQSEFTVTRHRTVFEGLCAACADKLRKTE